MIIFPKTFPSSMVTSPTLRLNIPIKIITINPIALIIVAYILLTFPLSVFILTCGNLPQKYYWHYFKDGIRPIDRVYKIREGQHFLLRPPLCWTLFNLTFPRPTVLKLHTASLRPMPWPGSSAPHLSHPLHTPRRMHARWPAPPHMGLAD